jgi:glycosyltransferase involved in cell wall biosynthesis
MKILWSSDSPTVNTGFGIVARNIIKRLREKGHEILVLGINHYGDPYDPEEFPYPIYPCDKGSHDNVFGTHKLWQIAKDFQPDLLFFLNDPWIIERYIQAKNVESPYLKTIAYFPIDAGPLKKSWAKALTGIDAQVCYSQFAERIVIAANDGKRPNNLYQVYHGVDRKTFRPINQQIARQQLGIPLDSFIVGMVARNQYRKRFDILVKAFAEFAKDKPDARLYLHTALKDIGFDIKQLTEEQFNIGDKLILTEGLTPAYGVPDDFLNLIYNSMDVHTLISLGDGFGLPVAESMSTGCPQLVSDHSCLKELVDGHGGLTVKNAAWLMNVTGINTWGGLSDEQDLVDKLNLLYNSRDLRIKLAEDGYRYITQDIFSWDYIAEQFNDIIKKVFHIL